MTNKRGRAILYLQSDKSIEAGDSALRRGGPVHEDQMFTKIIGVIMLCLAMMTVVAWPLPLFQSDVINAVQDVRIANSEVRIDDLQNTVRAMDSKINYMLGGIAGIYGIIAIVGFLNLQLLKKKV